EYMIKSGQVYKLSIRAAGHLPQQLNVSVNAGEKRTLNAQLVEAGTLKIDANIPEARVFVDGAPVGKLPLDDLAIAIGKHKIDVRGKRPWISVSKDVDVKVGQTVALDFNLGFVEVTIPNATALPKG